MHQLQDVDNPSERRCAYTGSLRRPNSLFDCSVYPREFGLDCRYASILRSLETSTGRWYLPPT